MKRITVALPDALAARLAFEAQRRRTSVSHVVRLVLEAHLDLTPTEPRPLPFARLGRSSQTDTGRSAADILAVEWDDAGAR